MHFFFIIVSISSDTIPDMPRRHCIGAYVRYLKRHLDAYTEAEARYVSEEPFEQYKHFSDFLRMAILCEDRGGGFRFGLRSTGQERKFDVAYDSLEREAHDYERIQHPDDRDRHYLNPSHEHGGFF